MKIYTIEEVKNIISTIRKATRKTHKPTTVELDDGRSITCSAMGTPYILKNTDGIEISRASNAEKLAELLNEQDDGLYRAWTESSDEAHAMAIDIPRVNGGREKLRQMADQLAASEEDVGARSDISPRWSHEFTQLTNEAHNILTCWEMEQITPAAAAALAELAKLGNPPLVQFVPSFGPEEISEILDQWALDHPGNGVWECEGC